jgi:hypothetical protein
MSGGFLRFMLGKIVLVLAIDWFFLYLWYMKKVTLSELVAHMRSGDHLFHQFNYEVFNSYIRGLGEARTVQGVSYCGTSGCAAGNLPALDSDFRFQAGGALVYKGDVVTPEVLAEYFGISEAAVDHLFYPMCQITSKFGGQLLTARASLDEVLDNFDQFLELYPNGDLV